MKNRKPDPPEERFPSHEQEVASATTSLFQQQSIRPLYYKYTYRNKNSSTESNIKRTRKKSSFQKLFLLSLCVTISMMFFFSSFMNEEEKKYISNNARNKNTTVKYHQSSSSLSNTETRSDKHEISKHNNDAMHFLTKEEKAAGSNNSKVLSSPKEQIIDKSAPIKSPKAAVNHDTPHENIDIQKALPTFSNLPSPTSFCHANANNATHAKLNSHCNITNCMQHKKEDLLQLDNHNLSHHNDRISSEKRCKMLWFSAMHESDKECKSSSHSYFVDYSVSLNSALRNARDTLQPVLVLGRYGMTYENSTEPKKLGRWADAKGVKVVYSPRLSFQEDVDQGMMKKGITGFSHRQGPFLRLDIPKMIKEHGLLDLPNVCKQHVLYTDVDVIFANDITMQDIEVLSNSVGKGIASYGREYGKNAHIFNTGVMVMNVKRLDDEMPKIIQHAKSLETYPEHDQQMLNWYREKNDQANEMFNLLPMQYNWKAYWGLEPSTFSEVKILHFHGPKLGRGLDEMSICDVDSAISNFPKQYHHLIRQGVCCDQGRTATWSIDAIKSLRDSMKDLCDEAVISK